MTETWVLIFWLVGVGNTHGATGSIIGYPTEQKCNDAAKAMPDSRRIVAFCIPGPSK